MKLEYPKFPKWFKNKNKFQVLIHAFALSRAEKLYSVYKNPNQSFIDYYGHYPLRIAPCLHFTTPTTPRSQPPASRLNIAVP